MAPYLCLQPYTWCVLASQWLSLCRISSTFVTLVSLGRWCPWSSAEVLWILTQIKSEKPCGGSHLGGRFPDYCCALPHNKSFFPPFLWRSESWYVFELVCKTVQSKEGDCDALLNWQIRCLWRSTIGKSWKKNVNINTWVKLAWSHKRSEKHNYNATVNWFSHMTVAPL